MYTYRQWFVFDKSCVPTKLLRPSIEPSPIQQPQICHTLDTAGTWDSGIATLNRHPSHPIRTLQMTPQSLLVMCVSSCRCAYA